MKNFFRFAHSGVKPYLVRLLENVRAKHPAIQVGSSGEGEITLKHTRKTVYARKYKRGDGWRVAECLGARELNIFYPASEVECLEVVTKALD